MVENRELWFADDNGLTKELCADPQENEDEQPEINEPCCACDEAKYEVLSNKPKLILSPLSSWPARPSVRPCVCEQIATERRPAVAIATVIYCYGILWLVTGHVRGSLVPPDASA